MLFVCSWTSRINYTKNERDRCIYLKIEKEKQISFECSATKKNKAIISNRAKDKMTREKMRGKEGESCDDARRLLLPPRRPWKSRRSERRGSQYGGWRGRARDKMATSEKLAEENHGDRSRRRARARSYSHVDRIPRVHASRLDKSTLKSQTAANSRGKFAYHFHHLKRRRRRWRLYYGYHDDATFPISPKHSPSRGTARRAISPAYLAQSFRNAVPYEKAKENHARSSNTEPTHLIGKI